jgi:hypothetical protein
METQNNTAHHRLDNLKAERALAAAQLGKLETEVTRGYYDLARLDHRITQAAADIAAHQAATAHTEAQRLIHLHRQTGTWAALGRVLGVHAATAKRYVLRAHQTARLQ